MMMPSFTKCRSKNSLALVSNVGYFLEGFKALSSASKPRPCWCGSDRACDQLHGRKFMDLTFLGRRCTPYSFRMLISSYTTNGSLASSRDTVCHSHPHSANIWKMLWVGPSSPHRSRLEQERSNSLIVSSQ